MNTQICSLKKHMGKRLTVEKLKLLLDEIDPKATIQFHNEKMIVITKSPIKFYTIYNNGLVKS